MAAIDIRSQFQAGTIGLAQLAGNEQTQSGAEMVGREEGLEYLRPYRFRHPLTIVDHM